MSEYGDTPGPDWSDESAWEAIKQGFNLGGMAEGETADLGEPTSLASFIAEGTTAGYASHDWAVPGLFEHRDKMIVTGPSGRGKTTLLRQLAITVAGGRYPWDKPGAGRQREFEPKTVAMLDCENRPSQTWRAFRALTDRMTTQYGSEAVKAAGQNLHVKVREEGVDLLNPANSERLLDFMGAISPDLIIIGPLYYLAVGDPNAEQVAVQVAKVLRKMTTEFNAALVIEAHSAKTPSNDKPRKDPQGANLWIKWPDMGRSIFPIDDNDPGLFEFAKFRGDREVRPELPDYLRLDWDSAGLPGQFLPWYADYPNGEQL